MIYHSYELKVHMNPNHSILMDIIDITMKRIYQILNIEQYMIVENIMGSGR